MGRFDSAVCSNFGYIMQSLDVIHVLVLTNLYLESLLISYYVLGFMVAVNVSGIVDLVPTKYRALV